VLYRKSSHRIVTQTQRRSFLLRASPCLVFARAHLSLPNAVRGTNGTLFYSIIRSLMCKTTFPLSVRNRSRQSSYSPSINQWQENSHFGNQTSARKKKPQIGIRKLFISFINLHVLLTKKENSLLIEQTALLSEKIEIQNAAKRTFIFTRPEQEREFTINDIREEKEQEREFTIKIVNNDEISFLFLSYGL